MIILASSFAIILASIVVFFLVISILVAVLLYARRKLTPQGEVTLTINRAKQLTLAPGGTILGALGDNGIYLPSACGGGGTCGLCKCQVPEGGGSILPTEQGFFTRRQQLAHWRLGCQVKVRGSMSIEVPEEVFGIRKWECQVVSNRNVATFIKELVVQLPPGERIDFRSGGYIQLDVPRCTVDYGKDIHVEPEYRDEWDAYRMWGLVMRNPEETYRAYSMANHPAEDNIIMLNVRIATPPWDGCKNEFVRVNPGICSSYIFSLKPADRVYISGPYGDFFVKDTGNEMMFIGGGAGMAPMRSHIFHLFHTARTGRRTTFWYGARSRREIFYEEHFRAIERQFPNFTFHIALSDPKPNDGWTGPVGFIHAVIQEQYLAQHPAPEDVEYYLCGPPQMNAAVLRMLYELGVPDEMVALDDFNG